MQRQKATQKRQYTGPYITWIVENYQECGIPAAPSVRVKPRRPSADRVYADYGHTKGGR